MAADPWKFYDSFHLYVADGTFDLDTDAFKLALYQSASNAATLSSTVLANLTNEVANGNGYTTGGITLSGVAFTLTGAVAKFTFTAPVWTASGGSIVTRFAVLYKSGTANARVNPLVAYTLLDNTPADVTVTATNTLTITPSGSGVFTISG